MALSRLQSISWVLLALLVSGGPLAAAEAVQFEDGRVLEVERVVSRGATLVLSLAGGSEMAVPAWRVAGWSTVERADRPAEPAEPGTTATRAAWQELAGDYADLIERAAATHRVDPILLTAVARTESSFDPRAVSPKGAQGLMQLMPQTATRFGVTDAFDAEQNVDGGARYLGWLLERFSGQTELALAGYNAGEAAVERHSGIPPYPETVAYVRKVLEQADRLRGQPSP